MAHEYAGTYCSNCSCIQHGDGSVTHFHSAITPVLVSPGHSQVASLTMNLLAFGLHTLLELTDQSYRLIRTTVGARRKFFTHLEPLTVYYPFESWEHLMDFMMRGLEIGHYTAQKH